MTHLTEYFRPCNQPNTDLIISTAAFPQRNENTVTTNTAAVKSKDERM